MRDLTIQLNVENTWQKAASLAFQTPHKVWLEYDLDYASRYLGRTDKAALSLCFPVALEPYEGPIPGFLLDLLPQGEPLRRILRRHRIKQDDDYESILRRAPLASPGNIRIAEPWRELDALRETYAHEGFELNDILQHQTEFVHYMEEHGAPIGGTSGAGGGSPKFLLRTDEKGRFHADGMLPDARTKKAYLVKFPYTDSENSRALSHTEKAYYDILRELPVNTGESLEIHGDILFITRFDREAAGKGRMHYHGLESLYGAHNINVHGERLQHEENLALIHRFSSAPVEDVLEYVKRDILNRLLANTDNHGRNTSFLKKDESVRLSPLYDVTAMQFFAADYIVELTRWRQEHQKLTKRMAWIASTFNIDPTDIKENLREFFQSVADLDTKLVKHTVPRDFIERSAALRATCLKDLKEFLDQ